MNISIEGYEINIPDGLVKAWATENGWAQGSGEIGLARAGFQQEMAEKERELKAARDSLLQEGMRANKLEGQLRIAGEALKIKDQLCETLRGEVDDLQRELVDKGQKINLLKEMLNSKLKHIQSPDY